MKRILFLSLIPLFLLSCGNGGKQAAPYSWEADLHRRLLDDFTLTEAQVKEQIAKTIPDVTDSMIRRWDDTKALEFMVIDGRKLYFHNAVPNLFRIDSACRALKLAQDGPREEPYYADDSIDLPAIIAAVKADGSPYAVSHRIRAKFTLTVHADAVPAGKMIRCWMPVPRGDIARQKDIRILSANGKYILAPDSCKHATLYMEKRAEAGKPTLFAEEFEYTVCGEWHDLSKMQAEPYRTDAEPYLTYTSERPTQIVFSPRIRSLSDSLTAGVDDPIGKARRIFAYITRYPWASSREYSTIANIPEYFLDNGHGDCGQFSLLFITLCRAAGIPARFQSGFMMHPHQFSMHDWATVYFEGIGWVPVDQSFGFEPFAKTDEEHWFFFGGIDSWRMVVNEDYGMPLYPAKRYPRSETVDFQRGEAEWEGGNVYFTDRDWNMQVSYP